MEKRESIKFNRMSTISDGPKASISVLLETMHQNYQFHKLILYSLNTLKSYLVIENIKQIYENSLMILKHNFMFLSYKIFNQNKDKEEIMIKLGEIFFYMLNFTENTIMGNKEYMDNEKIYELFKKENGIGFIINFLRNSPLEFVEANKVFLKILQHIIDRELKSMQNSSTSYLQEDEIIRDESKYQNQENYSYSNNNFELKEYNLSDYFNLIIFSIGKFEKNNGIIIYLFDIIKTLISNKKFEESFYSNLLDILFKQLYITNSSKIAANGFHILDLILKNSDNYELIRNKNPLNLVVRILTNFRNDNIVSFHACGFLSKVLEKEDVNNFLKIMKIKNVKNLEIAEEEMDVDTFLPEIREILSSEDNENKLNSLKKNIIRVLILMSKDRNFLQLLKDINCLDIFVKLLKSDLEIIELKNEKERLLKEEEKLGKKSEKEENKEESKYERLEKKFGKKVLKKHTQIIKDKEDFCEGEEESQETKKNNLDILLDIQNGNLNEISIIENQLPEFFKLVICLLKNSEFIENNESDQIFRNNSIVSKVSSTTNILPDDNNLNNSNINSSQKNFYTSEMMNEIFWCLNKALKYLMNDSEVVYDILDYLICKDKIITSNFLSSINFEELNNLLVELFINYYDTKWIYNYFFRLNILMNEHDHYKRDELPSLIESCSAIFDAISQDYFKLTEIQEENENENKSNSSKNLNEDNDNPIDNINADHPVKLFKSITEKDKFIFNIFSIAINLMFNNNSFKENSFHNFYIFMTKIIENLDIFSGENLIEMGLISTAFCCCEHKFFGESTEKMNILSTILQQFLHNSENINEKSTKYILMRLNRLIENHHSDNNLSVLLKSELIIEIIILILNFISKTYSKKEKVDESFAKTTINLINSVLMFKDANALVSRFFNDDGLILLMQLALISVNDYDFNRIFITILQSFSNKYFKETSIFFKNFLALRKFITKLKEIKFSKGLNEKVYYEFLLLFKNIIKSVDFIEAVDYSLFLEHIIGECNEIYCFYIDPRNRLIEMITEIIFIFCKEKLLLKNIINSNYPNLLENLIKNSFDNGEDDLKDKTLEMYIGILTSFFKSSEFMKFVYQKLSKSIEYLKLIALNFHISEKCLIKIINLFKIIVENENLENLNLKDRLISSVFLRELLIKIPMEKEDLRNKIEEINTFIENPLQSQENKGNRKNFYDDNTKLLKELSELVKHDRKKAIRKNSNSNRRTRKMSNNSLSQPTSEAENNTNSHVRNTIHNIPEAEDNEVNAKRSSIKITDNTTLSFQFDKIIANLGNIIDYLQEKCSRFNSTDDSINLNIYNETTFQTNNYEYENEQISDFLKLIGIFSREEENIERICENEILDKLIIILDNTLVLKYIKDQTINLLDKLSEYKYFIESFYKSGKSCDFILKKFNNLNEILKRKNENNNNASEYDKNFVNIITKILSKLSKDDIFILNNSDNLSFRNIYSILNEVDLTKECTTNILLILNNLIILNVNKISNNENNSSVTGSKNPSPKNIGSIGSNMMMKKSVNFNTMNSMNSNSSISNLNNNYNENFITSNCSKLSYLIIKLWKKFPIEIKVLEILMKIIENLYLEEAIIRDLIDAGILNSINEILNDLKINSESITNIFEMIDKLMFHRYFASKVVEQKSLYFISNTVYLNIFNTKIVEKGISIFLKGSKTDKNFIAIMGFFGMNEFCIKILNKYMTTCHSNIVKSISELILRLISEENNLRTFAIGENMDIILKAFKTNLKSKEQVLISLKIVNFITTKDAEYNKYDINRVEKKENLLKKKRDSFYSKISNVSSKINVNYDFTILIEIINEILGNYDDSYDIIMQLCELINNLFQLTSEIWLKKFLMDVIINNEDKYLTKQEFMEIFLQTLCLMVKSDQSILEMDSQSILFFISKLMDTKLNLNLLIWIIKIFKQITKAKSINNSGNTNELLKILDIIIQMETLHEDELIYYISLIIGSMCSNTTFYLETKTQHYFVFLLKYISKKDAFNVLQAKILEDMKNISVYFLIDNSDCTKETAEYINKLFDSNLENCNKKNLMNIFQITSSLCIKSENLKLAFSDLKFLYKLKELIEKDILKDTMLEYQAKGCLVNLKLKKMSLEDGQSLKKSNTLKTLDIHIESTEINDNLRKFLNTERQIKLYTDKGEIKNKYISFNSELNCIAAYNKTKSKNEIFQQMVLDEMESCVRSCTTSAFSKSKGLFTKKPKPARCFSILGVKSLSGYKTFNVECENEEECIKYVDYITILIQNMKAKSDNGHRNSIFNKPSASHTVRIPNHPSRGSAKSDYFINSLDDNSSLWSNK